MMSDQKNAKKGLEHVTVKAHKTPTPTLLAVAIAALGIPLAVTGGWKGALVVNLGLLLLGVVDYALSLRDKVLRPERRCPSTFSLGMAHTIEIHLFNPTHHNIRIQIRDQTPLAWPGPPVLKGIVRGRSSLTLDYRVIPPDRGVYAFGDLFVRVSGPLGLLYRSLQYGLAEEIRAYPGLQPFRYQDLSTYRRVNRLWGARPARWLGDGREFESLREYMEGDDFRQVDWKASARLDRPIVQVHQPEKNQNVMILLDAGRLMSAVTRGKTKLDYALEAAVHLSRSVLSGGDRAGLLTFADQVMTFVPPNRTPEQLHLILEQALPAQPVMMEPHYERAFLYFRSRVRRRSLVVLFTDLLDETASERLLNAVALLRPAHLPLCIAIRESEWETRSNEVPSDVVDVYERTVLQESLRQRKRALRGLIQKGAMAMDLSPARISVETLERYLEIKRRGLL